MGTTPGMNFCQEAITAQENDIRCLNLKPLSCPRCENWTLWPEIEGRRNYLSQYDPKETICKLCIEDEQLQIRLNLPERKSI